MTVPYYIEDPFTLKEVKVPQEIVYYCDLFTLDSNRDELSYYDCVSMQMGYYDNSKDILKHMRKEYIDNHTLTHPVFE